LEKHVLSEKPCSAHVEVQVAIEQYDYDPLTFFFRVHT
jgi:hypothetical protein